ncbi:MAG: glycosyltransferase involved in cell wall biosynthesis [Gammaproteobacteria bacterium]|jgi:glycosyltransferase involved in cell wall biosynthesis
MRSMHVIGSREEGGAERFYLRLMRALVANGEDVLFVLRPSSVLMERLPAGVQVETVRMRSVFDPFARARMSSLARAFDAQVVQTYLGRATRLTRMPTKSSKIVHVAWIGGRYDLKGYRHANAWIASTDAISQYLIDGGMPPDRVFKIRNLVDEPALVPNNERAVLRYDLGLKESDSLLICVGRLHRDRGVDLALDALAKLPHKVHDSELHLLVVGDGPQRIALQQQAAQLGIAGRVHWVIGAANPHPYASLADLLLYPSRDAALETVVLEGWSYGLIAVATKTAGPNELIREGETGFLSAVDDVDAFAAAILKGLELDQSARERMRAAVQLKLTGEHSAEAVAAAHVEVYRKLVS